MRRFRPAAAWLLLWLTTAADGQAQTESSTAINDTPSFTLATSQIFSTRDQPAVTLIYRRVDHLDFRTYKVNDPFAFFARLRDPHQLGSESPVVPQERTWLERIALWKAARRSDARAFVRQQFSREYRQERRRRTDADEVVLRRTINVNNFAQVPVLNASQLMSSWRELLPPVRDAEYRRVPLDLTAPGVYVVEAVNGPLKAYTVVIVSDVGVVTKTAPGQLLVFAAHRFSGAPQAECRVQVLADGQPVANGVTDPEGVFESVVAAVESDHLVTIAQCGNQTAATDPGSYSIRRTTRELVGYIYTDRPVYRPGHIVRFKAVLRWRDKGALLPFAREPVEVTVVDDAEKVLLRERKTVDEFGAVFGSVTLPRAAGLGYYRVTVTRGDDSASGSFEVQEYRKPEYDVAVRPAASFALQSGTIAVTIESRYYFGQPVANAQVKYVLQKQPYYSPLRFDGGEDFPGGGWYGGTEELQGTARLDERGLATISIPLELDEEGRDYTARIEARVVDDAGREVAGTGTVNATFGRFLVVARPERYVYAAGAQATVNLRAISYEGEPQPSVRVHAAVERVEYRRDGDPLITQIQQADISTDAEGRAVWGPQVPAVAGSYRVRISALSEGRQVTDTAYFYVPGSSDNGFDREQTLELIADKRTYQPGDSARVVVRGSDFDAPVLVTKESQQVTYHRVVRARSNEAIDVPVDAGDVGDTYVSLIFLKDDRLYRAERRLSVPATEHQLTVTAAADKPVVRPGEPGTFTLLVANAAGAPVRAQLSVGLVDEAVYGVRADSTPDPLRFFYRREYNNVATQFSREYSFVGYSGTEQLLLAAQRRRPMTLADFKADRPDRPRVRKDFPDTAFWAGDVTTDAQGRAQLRIDYPDSLTTWRLTVRAVTTSTAVGATQTRTITTKDLILRVITPRFLTEGDKVTIPAIVHNYLPDAKNVTLSVAADGLTTGPTAADRGPRSITIAANGEQRADWQFSADAVRAVSLTGKATTDVASDALQVSLPVLPAGLQRNTGSSGSIVGATAERQLELAVPSSANASGRSIRVSLAPSLAGTLLNALDYLTSFPWGCTEQTLSSFVPNLVVLRAMAELKLAPTERLSALDRQVSDGLKRLYDYQHDDGGWGWWKTDQNHPFMTAYALDGLLQARDNGVDVQPVRVESARRALEGLYTQYPRAMPDLKAYELYVLARSAAAATVDTLNAPGAVDIQAALDELWSSRQRMSASGQALLLLTLDFRKDPRGTPLASELMGSAQTRGELSWWAVDIDPLLEDIVDTSAEATALALQALAPREPQNPLLERAARWLVASRSAGGYWISTKQTAMALRGLLAFMQARGERPVPTSADVFANGTRIGTHTFDANALTAPNPVLIEAPAAAGANAIRIVRRGEGAVYYDASIRYYDKPAAAERTGSRKLALVRRYVVLSPVTRDGRIVYRENAFNGTARPGDLILVRLTAAGSADWRYLMIEDPIPAGTEAVERDELYELERRPAWYWGSQRELRDDRVVFFQERFADGGRSEFSYLLKVTTPGTFSAMPARISPMYVPDVSASSEVITVTVSADGIQ